MSLTNKIMHVGERDFLPYIPIQDFIAVMVWCQEILNDPLHVQNRVGNYLDDMGHWSRICSFEFERSITRSCSVPFISSLDTTMSSFFFPSIHSNIFSGLLWWQSVKNTDWVLPLNWKNTSMGRIEILFLHWHFILDIINWFAGWYGLSWMMISACWFPLILSKTCWKTWGSSSILFRPNSVIDPSARFDGKVDSANSLSLNLIWDIFPLHIQGILDTYFI